MKKIFRFSGGLIIVSALFLSTLWQGCTEDFLEAHNSDKITPDQHYRTVEDLGSAIMGAISPIQDKLPGLIMLDGLLSDMMELTPNADPMLQNIYNHELDPANPFVDPADLYKVIINLNDILANLDKVEDRELDEVVIKPQLIGAIIGMRAWVYFTIAQYYGEVTYLEGNITSLPQDLNFPVIGKDAIIDTLINQVKPYIHNSDSTSFAEVRVFRYVNNKALLGQLYLEKNDYSNAIFYLKLACESYLNQPRVYKVDNTYKDNAWSNIFLNAETQELENISVMPYSSRDQQNNPLASWMGYDLEYMVKPSKVLVDSFMMQQRTAGADPGDLWRGFGVTFSGTVTMINDTTSILTDTYITKYAVDDIDPRSSDIIISRASDVHLLLAEAYNRMGDPVSETLALLLLNAGMNSANPKPAGYTRWTNNLGIRGRVALKAREVPVSLTGIDRIEYIEDLIIAERAMELAFEGKRYTDLIRIANRRQDPSYLADKVAAKFAGTGQYDVIRNKLMQSSEWYLPTGITD